MAKVGMRSGLGVYLISEEFVATYHCGRLLGFIAASMALVSVRPEDGDRRVRLTAG